MNDWRRVQVWRDETIDTKVRLVLNDLDEFDDRLARVERGVTKRLNWIIGLIVSLLLAISASAVAMLNASG